MKNVEAQAMMSRLADNYDKLAERAELRAKADPDAGSVQQKGAGL